MRDEVLAARFDGQLQLTLQRALHVGKLHVQAFQAPENIPAGLLQRLCRFSQVELFADVFEQRLADQLFELANLQADSGLCQRHLFGSTAV